MNVKKEQTTILSLALQRDRVCRLHSDALLNHYIKRAFVRDVFRNKSSLSHVLSLSSIEREIKSRLQERRTNSDD